MTELGESQLARLPDLKQRVMLFGSEGARPTRPNLVSSWCAYLPALRESLKIVAPELQHRRPWVLSRPFAHCRDLAYVRKGEHPMR